MELLVKFSMKLLKELLISKLIVGIISRESNQFLKRAEGIFKGISEDFFFQCCLRNSLRSCEEIFKKKNAKHFLKTLRKHFQRNWANQFPKFFEENTKAVLIKNNQKQLCTERVFKKVCKKNKFSKPIADEKFTEICLKKSSMEFSKKKWKQLS